MQSIDITLYPVLFLIAGELLKKKSIFLKAFLKHDDVLLTHFCAEHKTTI